MELDSAREYATNEGSTLHFAGEFGVAELLMKRIEETYNLVSRVVLLSVIKHK